MLAYRAIHGSRSRGTGALMIGAAVTSAVFLVSYLTYHAQVGSVRFAAQGLSARSTSRS